MVNKSYPRQLFLRQKTGAVYGQFKVHMLQFPFKTMQFADRVKSATTIFTQKIGVVYSQFKVHMLQFPFKSMQLMLFWGISTHAWEVHYTMENQFWLQLSYLLQFFRKVVMFGLHAELTCQTARKMIKLYMDYMLAGKWKKALALLAAWDLDPWPQTIRLLEGLVAVLVLTSSSTMMMIHVTILATFRQHSLCLH